MREEIRVKITNSHHVQIDLANMNIQDNEIEEIAREINLLHPNVQDIFLNNNKISDDGACTLGKELELLPNLSSIDLQFNKIDKIGAAALIVLKANHPHLVLALHGNRIVDVADMQEIEDAAKNLANNTDR